MRPTFGDTRPLFGYPETGQREGHPPLPPVIGEQLGMDGTIYRRGARDIEGVLCAIGSPPRDEGLAGDIIIREVNDDDTRDQTDTAQAGGYDPSCPRCGEAPGPLPPAVGA